jgi:hypothetical protein
MDRRERLDDPEESLRMALESHASQIWTALPAVVVSVNLTAQTVVVQPSIQGSVASPDGKTQLVNLPVLVDVPIVWPKAGGFALTFPVAAGDEVLVVFSARCIDSWWQSGGVGAPAEARMHDLSDGFAILAPTSQPKKLANVSSSNVQLRNYAGTTLVEITPDGKANIVGASEINMTAPNVKVNGTLNVTGAITQSGGAVAVGGAMTVTGGLDVGGIAFASHKHTGVQTGGGTSGGPTN